jgi:hypothetical protein
MASRKNPPSSSVTPFPRSSKSGTTGAAQPAPQEPAVDLAQVQEQIALITEGVAESLALLHAIDLGELLSAVPGGASDRKRHETAVGLLSIQDRLLKELLLRCQRLQALE